MGRRKEQYSPGDSVPGASSRQYRQSKEPSGLEKTEKATAGARPGKKAQRRRRGSPLRVVLRSKDSWAKGSVSPAWKRREFVKDGIVTGKIFFVYTNVVC